MSGLALNTQNLYAMLSQYAAPHSLARLSSPANISTVSGQPANTALNASQSILSSYQNQAKISAYGQLRSALDTLQSRAHALSNSSELSSFKTSNAQGASIGTADNSAAAGAYSVAVSQWAQFQTLQSSSFESDKNTIGSGGDSSISIKVGAATTKIAIGSSNNSLSGIAEAINNAKSGVVASVVGDSSGYKLSLSADPNGSANQFSIDVSGDAHLKNQFSYAPGAKDGMTQTVAAQDALFTINGVAHSKSSNIISDAIQGVNIDLNKIDRSNPSTVVSISADSSGIEKAAQDFTNAYNALLNTTNNVIRNDKTIANDPKVQLALTGIQDIVNQYNTGGTSALTVIGIAPQKDGSLVLNTNTLRDSFNSNSNAVTQALSSLGQMTESLIKNKIDPLSYSPINTYGNGKKTLSAFENLQNSLKARANNTGFNVGPSTNNFAQLGSHDYGSTFGATVQTKNATTPTAVSASATTSSGSPAGGGSTSGSDSASSSGSTSGSGSTSNSGSTPDDDNKDDKHYDSGWHRSERGAKQSNNYYDHSSKESDDRAQMLARLKQLSHSHR